LLDSKLNTLSVNYVPNFWQFPTPKIAAINGTQPDAWTPASLTLAPAKNRWKNAAFRRLFDTWFV
jgi:hypothetical protein